MLYVTELAATVDLSKEWKQEIDLLNETMKFVNYIYGNNFLDIVERHDDGAREEIVDGLDFLLCNPSSNVKHRSESESIRQDVFGPNEIDDFCDMEMKLTKPDCNCPVFVWISNFTLAGEYCSV